jgi:UDP-N-acetylmuramoylalanine--D-glutamate ligase
MINFRNKQVAVFGIGKSGRALTEKLHNLGARVIATDTRTAAELTLGCLKKLSRVRFFFGEHPEEVLKNTDLIVLSPAVHLDLPVLEKARQKKIPVIGEVELAAKLLTKPIVAVTGTNGKSTTTALIGELLKNGGYRVKVAGNIGFPLTLVRDRNLDYIVAEISSYQLETIKNFRPLVSVILNITPDHMERHHSLVGYAQMKARIFENQIKEDFLVYNADDPWVKKIVNKAAVRKIPFSLKGQAPGGIYLDKDSQIVSEISGRKIKLLPSGRLSLPGDHNVENFMAAAAVALILKVKPAALRKTLVTFKGLEHRLEFVREVSGVKFYNDSKGTNPDSTVIALKALADKKKKRIVLIAGGRDKGTALGKLGSAIKKSVQAVILIGEAAPRFEKNFRRFCGRRLSSAATFKEAVSRAYELARPGEIVLLSPAAASFDMFKNFEHRGRVFKKLVWALKEKRL